MALSKKQFAQYIREFNFRELFNDMGWNNDKTSLPIIVDEETFMLKSVAVKSGFKILVCNPDRNGLIPEYNTRKKIETKVTKLFQEHLIIFTDAKKKEQVWQLVMRQSGKPTKVTETRYAITQDPELLFQRASGLLFELDEEEKITIVDVTKRVADNFHQNAEKVTKQFYEKFKKEHVSFYAFIKGIDDHIDEWNKKRKKGEAEQENKSKQWYVSLMLNRLMFCYFIQKKGFLDKNTNYLREKLKECKQKKGKDKFYSFYRNFLLVLFHEGLNEPAQKEKIKIEIGKIPYLNGGLFDEHELEKSYDIDIDDKAFERIFDFFDEYEWHLDTRIHATGKDINPDVIGYIFEKYINDRAQMGAYYTKEDITDYIGKNCIIPWLFDETARQYPKAFAPGGEIWQELKESGDAYIYPAVKHGVSEPLPKEVAEGIKDVAKRTAWNRDAPEQVALPTEIWREVVERRRRYEEVAQKIKTGTITNINDFITYNLNIRQFAQDVIENTTDPEFLKAFYKALNSVTIIDPTCGSGAFLFAVMNILEPLYEACIQRMEIFVQEGQKGKYKFFEQTLDYVNAPEHPNRSYFIYKSIILCNLYGVDIMKEAVEIAKLRLFLKLVATVEADYRKPNLGLEPLPDIDFNIRAGNTLVGFATENELKKGGRYTFDFDNQMPVIEEKCDIVAKAFARYKEIQLSYGDDFREFKKAKENLNKRLKELNKELNKLLHKQAEGINYDQWLETHQPFHWFAEYYEIIHDRKGFDIILGNPPYLALRKLTYKLNVQGYRSSDLFGYVIRRCFEILHQSSRYGFIVMHNLAFSRNFSDVRKLVKANAATSWFSFFARIPAGLFSGDVRVRNCIFLLEKNSQKKQKQFYTTRIHRWFSEARECLFQKLTYTSFHLDDVIPMYNDEVMAKFLQGLKGKSLSQYEVSRSKNILYFKQSAYNWIAVSTDPAPCYKNGKKIAQSQVSEIALVSEDVKKLTLLLLNGRLFFTYWLTYGDEFHVTRDDLLSIRVPFDSLNGEDRKSLLKLSSEVESELEETIQYKLNAGKEVGTYNTSKLWHLTDRSDKIFLKYLAEKPAVVFDAVENHVSQTVITVNDEDADEE